MATTVLVKAITLKGMEKSGTGKVNKRVFVINCTVSWSIEAFNKAALRNKRIKEKVQLAIKNERVR